MNEPFVLDGKKIGGAVVLQQVSIIVTEREKKVSRTSSEGAALYI
jgi:hypothetical protein